MPKTRTTVVCNAARELVRTLEGLNLGCILIGEMAAYLHGVPNVPTVSKYLLLYLCKRSIVLTRVDIILRISRPLLSLVYLEDFWGTISQRPLFIPIPSNFESGPIRRNPTPPRWHISTLQSHRQRRIGAISNWSQCQILRLPNSSQ